MSTLLATADDLVQAVDGTLADTVPVNTLWVVDRGGARAVHAGRIRHARDRLLAREERRNRGREDPHEPLDRGHLLLGGRLRVRLRQRRRARHLQRRSWAATASSCSSRERRRGLPGDGRLGRDGRVQVAVPVRVLRGVAGDRLGLDARADQVRRLRDLRDRVRGDHLPDRLALGVRRRLAAERRHRPDAHRHAGLRRLDRGAPDRRHRRPCGAAAARPAQGQVRARRQAAGDPGPLDAARRASAC